LSCQEAVTTAVAVVVLPVEDVAVTTTVYCVPGVNEPVNVPEAVCPGVIELGENEPVTGTVEPLW